MRINHNIAALNTYRQLNGATNAQSKAMEKLSSGLRINRAGDDAAGLAISEKMRAQIKGLDQASANAQDGISMLQTAEGALNETHSILQRMRELATQAANDTNVEVDRNEIQKEINQLSSEINRIGNTTEFNTQSLLKGDGGVKLEGIGLKAEELGKISGGAERTTTEATQTLEITKEAVAGNTAKFILNGQELTVSFAAKDAGGYDDNTAYNVTAKAATVNIKTGQDVAQTATDLRAALQQMIDKNDELKGQYVVTGAGDNVTVSAVKGGKFEGAAGVIGDAVLTGITATAVTGDTGVTTAAAAATKTITMPAYSSVADLVGKGMTINGTAIEFYDATKGVYTGSAQGIDIGAAANKADVTDAIVAQAKIDGVVLSNASDNLKVTAATGGLAGNNITIADGGIQKNFEATFQVGANKGQSMTIDINDMRSLALGITAAAGTAGFVNENSVTNGTDNVTREAALDVSSHESATAAIKVINDSIETVSAERSKLGAYQNRLEHTINNLGTSSENLTAAESRIRDVDMAKEIMESTKSGILAQAAQAMMAQANQQPQGVLQLLR